MGVAVLEVQWELTEGDAFKRIVRAGGEMATAHDGAFGARRTRRPGAGALVPLQRGRRAQCRRPHAHRARRGLHTARALCLCLLPAVRAGPLRRLPRHGEAATGPGVHLGDYIYESSWGRDHVRHHTGGVPTDLPEYRTRYALYKSDADLQATHAAFPWLVIWDDHEVANDYTNDISPTMSGPAQFLQTCAAAYRAWWEHMPMPRQDHRRRPNRTSASEYQPRLTAIEIFRYGRFQEDRWSLHGARHHSGIPVDDSPLGVVNDLGVVRPIAWNRVPSCNASMAVVSRMLRSDRRAATRFCSARTARSRCARPRSRRSPSSWPGSSAGSSAPSPRP
jgi:hypothetical protein